MKNILKLMLVGIFVIAVVITLGWLFAVFIGVVLTWLFVGWVFDAPFTVSQNGREIGIYRRSTGFVRKEK